MELSSPEPSSPPPLQVEYNNVPNITSDQQYLSSIVNNPQQEALLEIPTVPTAGESTDEELFEAITTNSTVNETPVKVTKKKKEKQAYTERYSRKTAPCIDKWISQRYATIAKLFRKHSKRPIAELVLIIVSKRQCWEYYTPRIYNHYQKEIKSVKSELIKTAGYDDVLSHTQKSTEMLKKFNFSNPMITTSPEKRRRPSRSAETMEIVETDAAESETQPEEAKMELIAADKPKQPEKDWSQYELGSAEINEQCKGIRRAIMERFIDVFPLQQISGALEQTGETEAKNSTEYVFFVGLYLISSTNIIVEISNNVSGTALELANQLRETWENTIKERLKKKGLSRDFELIRLLDGEDIEKYSTVVDNVRLREMVIDRDNRILELTQALIDKEQAYQQLLAAQKVVPESGDKNLVPAAGDKIFVPEYRDTINNEGISDIESIPDIQIINQTSIPEKTVAQSTEQTQQSITQTAPKKRGRKPIADRRSKATEIVLMHPIGTLIRGSLDSLDELLDDAIVKFLTEKSLSEMNQKIRSQLFVLPPQAYNPTTHSLTGGYIGMESMLIQAVKRAKIWMFVMCDNCHWWGYLFHLDPAELDIPNAHLIVQCRSFDSMSGRNTRSFSNNPLHLKFAQNTLRSALGLGEHQFTFLPMQQIPVKKQNDVISCGLYLIYNFRKILNSLVDNEILISDPNFDNWINSINFEDVDINEYRKELRAELESLMRIPEFQPAQTEQKQQPQKQTKRKAVTKPILVIDSAAEAERRNAEARDAINKYILPIVHDILQQQESLKKQKTGELTSTSEIKQSEKTPTTSIRLDEPFVYGDSIKIAFVYSLFAQKKLIEPFRYLKKKVGTYPKGDADDKITKLKLFFKKNLLSSNRLLRKDAHIERALIEYYYGLLENIRCIHSLIAAIEKKINKRVHITMTICLDQISIEELDKHFNEWKDKFEEVPEIETIKLFQYGFALKYIEAINGVNDKFDIKFVDHTDYFNSIMIDEVREYCPSSFLGTVHRYYEAFTKQTDADFVFLRDLDNIMNVEEEGIKLIPSSKG